MLNLMIKKKTMSSKELAEKILRAEKVAEYVRQISSVDFCMKKDESEKNNIFINTRVNGLLDKPLISLNEDDLPKVVDEEVGIEKACKILNRHLEEAKFEIIEMIQSSINGDEFENKSDNEDDGFLPIGD